MPQRDGNMMDVGVRMTGGRCHH